MGVNGNDFVSFVQAGDQKFIAGLFCGVAFEIALIAGITNVHIIFHLIIRFHRIRCRLPIKLPLGLIISITVSTEK